MRVGIVSGDLRSSGTSRYAKELYSNLSACTDIDLSLVELKYESRHMNTWSQSGSAGTIEIPFSMPHKYLFYAYAMRQLPQFDLLHFVTQNLSFLAGKSSIVTCLDLIHHVFPERVYDPVLAKILYSGLRRARRIAAISDATKKDLVELYDIDPRVVHVTYLAVDTRKFHPIRIADEHYHHLGLDSGCRYVLQLTSGTLRKNVHGVLGAFAKLKRDSALDPLKLIVAGGFQYASDEDRIRKLAKHYGLLDEIHFTGRLTDRELCIVYNLAEVFAFPSFYEGFGFPVLEAMACGTPVVTSNVSSLPEVAGAAGVLVNPKSITSIEHGMRMILEDQDLAHQKSQEGRKQARKFSWDKTAQETLNIYKLALSNNNA